MSSRLIDEIADKHYMRDAYIQGFNTQKDADELYHAIIHDIGACGECEVRQFASGSYFVVLMPAPTA